MLNSHLVVGSFMLVAALGCEGPAADDSETSSAAITSQLSPGAEALWQSYVKKTTAGAHLQKGCEPTRFSPPANVPYKGVVILFHGFTACPQQYFELSPRLAAEGYEVLLPLLPGHGHVPQRSGSTIVDDVSDLPTGATKGRYADLGLAMNDIARASTGVRVMGGLSLGGAVATAAMTAAPGLYARGLLLSPLFAIPGVSGNALKAANVLTPTRRTGWGEGCLTERTSPKPRAGICEFQFNQVRGAAEFAEATAASASTIPGLQIAGVEADGAADDNATQRVARATGASFCFYPKGVSHSLLSRFDAPSEDKFWLPTVLAQITAFVAAGIAFPTAETSIELPALRCRL